MTRRARVVLDTAAARRAAADSSSRRRSWRRGRTGAVWAVLLLFCWGCSTPLEPAAPAGLAGRYQVTLDGADSRQGTAVIGMADLRVTPTELRGTIVLQGACGTADAPTDCHWTVTGTEDAQGWIRLRTAAQEIVWDLRRTPSMDLRGTWASKLAGRPWTGASRWSPIR